MNFHPCHPLSWSKSHWMGYHHHAMLVGWACSLTMLWCVCALVCLRMYDIVYYCLFTCCRSQEVGKLYLSTLGCKSMVLLGFSSPPDFKGNVSGTASPFKLVVTMLCAHLRSFSLAMLMFHSASHLQVLLWLKSVYIGWASCIPPNCTKLVPRYSQVCFQG